MELSFLPTIVLVLLGIVVLGGGIALATDVGEPSGFRVGAGCLGPIIGGVLIIVGFSLVSVPAGNVGVLLNFGHVQDETMQPGLHFVLPVVNSVVNIQTRVQPHNFEKITAATKENLTVSVTGTMNYHVDGQYASSLYQTVGNDFASKIIDPAFSDFIKQITPAYSADSGASNFILAKRDEIRQLTKTQLNENLARYHIVVDDIYIVDIAYPQAFEDSITAKQVAQQQVQTEQQVLEQKRIQAQQVVVVAQGQADAVVVAAKAQAQANDLLSQSLTDKLIQYTLISKLAPTITTIILPNGQNFILDPKTLVPTPK